MRAHWRGWLSLGLLLGLVAGAVLAGAAGARRTDSAYPRFLRTQRAADTIVYTSALGVGPAGELPVDQVVSLPQVADAAVLNGFQVTDPAIDVAVNPDGHFGTTVDRFKLLAGRRPDPSRSDEALVGFVTAERLHLHVGSTLALSFLPTAPAAQPSQSAPSPGGGPQGNLPPVVGTFRVVGIEAAPGEFPPSNFNTLLPLVVSTAFMDTPLGRTSHVVDAVMVRLRHGPSDLPSFTTALKARGGRRPSYAAGLAAQSANVQRSIHLQAVGLWLVAAIGAAVGLLILLQLLARQISLSATDHPVLRAIGMTTGQLWALSLLGPCLVACAGSVVGILFALALSPLTPVGVARVAELHPGLAADGVILSLGPAGLLLVVVGMAAVPAWVMVARTRAGAARGDGTPLQPSGIAMALGRLALPPTVATGARLALEPGRGKAAIPVRTSLTAAAVSLAAVSAALTFLASSTYLLTTPRLYGVTYDVDVEASGQSGAAEAVARIEHDADVAGLALVNAGGPLQVRGVATQAESIQVVQGLRELLWPPLAEGRLPENPGEIALGSATMKAAGIRVGDEVPVLVSQISSQPSRLRVVGRVVLPVLADQEELGHGAVLSRETLVALVPAGFRVPQPSHLLVRLTPGASQAAGLARLEREVGSSGTFAAVAPSAPADLVNFGRVRALPLALAALVAALAIGTLAHLLITSVRRRRRDLAVLKTIGFVPRQVQAVVGWQATTLAMVALASGLPLGIVAGQWAWRLVAGQLGVVPQPRMPALALLIILPATVAVANLVAVLPAIVAGRLEVAESLRGE